MFSKRLFLGFSLTEGETVAIGNLQQRLSKHNQPLIGDKVNPSNLHLTLAFLGDVTETTQVQLCDAIAAMPKPVFSQTLDKLVHWPGARVLCLAGKVDDGALMHMANNTQAIAAKLKLHVSEHGFTPHITLVRKTTQCALPDWAPEPLTLTPNALHLYHSQSTSAGVQYQILRSWQLNK